MVFRIFILCCQSLSLLFCVIPLKSCTIYTFEPSTNSQGHNKEFIASGHGYPKQWTLIRLKLAIHSYRPVVFLYQILRIRTRRADKLWSRDANMAWAPKSIYGTSELLSWAKMVSAKQVKWDNSDYFINIFKPVRCERRCVCIDCYRCSPSIVFHIAIFFFFFLQYKRSKHAQSILNFSTTITKE